MNAECLLSTFGACATPPLCGPSDLNPSPTPAPTHAHKSAQPESCTSPPPVHTPRYLSTFCNVLSTIRATRAHGPRSWSCLPPPGPHPALPPAT
eukprot:357161-Chlamydomonas_euryale.AAC.3